MALGVCLASVAFVLRRSAALVLIVLGLLPFTAPFPSYEFATDGSSHSTRAHTQTTSLADPSALRAASIGISIGRPRLAALAGLHQASTAVERPAGAVRPSSSEWWIATHAISLTILRI